jgi:hypothetical protein
MLFFAGGIIPLPFLPQEIHILRTVSIPYWASHIGNGNEQGLLILAGMGVLFILLALAVEIRRNR